MRKKVKTHWYIELRDGATNESAMADLARICDATPDNIHMNAKDRAGKPHNLVEVPYSFIDKMERSKRIFRFNFRIFHRRGGEEVVREWKFADKGNVRQSRAVRMTQRDIRLIAR